MILQGIRYRERSAETRVSCPGAICLDRRESRARHAKPARRPIPSRPERCAIERLCLHIQPAAALQMPAAVDAPTQPKVDDHRAASSRQRRDTRL
jgi:hypothetical protein